MKALLLDTGFSAAPILRALKRRGLEVVTMGRDPRDDLVSQSDHYVEADYANTGNVVQAFLDVSADVIVPGCTDVSYLSASRAAAELQLSGYDDPAVVELLHSKNCFRELCHQVGVPAPRVYEATTFAASFGSPVIIKPVDSYSGRGITVLKNPNPETFEKALLMAREASTSKEVIVEDYIEGQLYSHSAFLFKGRVVSHFSVVEFGFESEFTVDTSFLGGDERAEPLNAMVESLARHVGIEHGLMHLQYLLSGPDIFAIELARRCPGDLYAELIKRSTNYDYGEAYVAAFLNQPPSSGPNEWDNMRVRRTIKSKDSQWAVEMKLPEGVRSLAYYPIKRPKRVGDDRVAIAIFHVDDARARDTMMATLSASKL